MAYLDHLRSAAENSSPGGSWTRRSFTDCTTAVSSPIFSSSRRRPPPVAGDGIRCGKNPREREQRGAKEVGMTGRCRNERKPYSPPVAENSETSAYPGRLAWAGPFIISFPFCLLFPFVYLLFGFLVNLAFNLYCSCSYILLEIKV